MQFTVDDLMRNSFVMIRDEAELARFTKRMEAAGFSEKPHPYRGIYPKVIAKDIYGCALTHFILVNTAKSLDLDHITIFESDAYPMKNCRSELEKMLADGIPDDTDELVLGNLHFIRDWTNRGCGHKCLYDVDSKGRIGRIKDDLWGAHAVVVFRQGYDTWLNNYLKQETQIGSDFFKWLTPNCYATTRSYFIQVKDELCYGDALCDKEYLSDFPEITP